MAWVAVAIGGATAIGSAIQANQTKQRNRGYISDSERVARQKLNVGQAYARESGAEGANARGLAQGGAVTANPIATAMDSKGIMRATGSPTTIGGQEQSDQGVQQGLEQRDLTNQVTRANRENNAIYSGALLNAGVKGVEAGISTHNAIGDWNAGKDAEAAAAAASAANAAPSPDVGAAPSPGYTPTGAPTPAGPSAAPLPPSDSGANPIYDSLLSQHAYGGVHVNDPLNSPSSSWYTRPKLANPNESVAGFNAD